MRTFEYVTILFSILLGVCITQMAINVVLVIQHFRTAVLYAPTILWNLAALFAILAHWVHFFKARERESWNAFQLSIVFITPLVYFIPATLLSRAPLIDGHFDYAQLWYENRTQVYVTVLLFCCLTMAQHYFVHGERKKFVYIYYSVAMVLVLLGLSWYSATYDITLSVGIVVAEVFNHFVFNPVKLP